MREPIWIRFGFMIFLLINPHVVFSCGKGTLSSYTNQPRAENWEVKNPKVVVAFGYLETPLVKRYSKFIKSYFEKHLRRIIPHMQVEVLLSAKGQEVIQSLLDRNTVGFVFISHTYQTQGAGALAITADGFPLPSGFLSAATPALRYISIYGCNGPNIPKEYQVAFELDRIPGRHVFFTNQERTLSAGCLGIDSLKRLIKEEMREIENRAQELFYPGVEPPDSSLDAVLSISVKDVLPRLEPRYVYVNGHIVGLIGSNGENSNTDSSYKHLEFNVPERFLKDLEGKWHNRHTIKIISANLSTHSVADDYLIHSVSLSGSQFHCAQEYCPDRWIGKGELPTRSNQLTFVDRTEAVWNHESYQGRFYIEHLFPIFNSVKDYSVARGIAGRINN